MFSNFGAILEIREPGKRAEISHPARPGASAQNTSRGLECRLPAALPPLDLSIISSGKYGLKISLVVFPGDLRHCLEWDVF